MTVGGTATTHGSLQGIMGTDVWMGMFLSVLSEQIRAGNLAGEADAETEVKGRLHSPPLVSVTVLFDEQTVVGAVSEKEGTHELVMLAVHESPVTSCT